MNKAELTPTLWRTCRTLANGKRLELLTRLFEHGEMTVSEAAERTDFAPDAASLMLRQLQARGLLSARRRSRWVFYCAAADPHVAHAAPLLAALRRSLPDPRYRPLVFRYLTAFTHPRRIAIVKTLASGPQWASTLRKTCSMSKAALIRHTRKLVARGFIAKHDEKYRLLRPRGLLARTLLQCAIDSP